MGSAAGQRARHFKLDPDVRRRVEPAIARTAPARGYLESSRARYKSPHRPARGTSALRIAIEEHPFEISAVLLLMCFVGWGLLFYNECRALFAAAPGPVTLHSTMSAGNADLGKTDSFATSSYARIDPPQAPTVARASVTADGESAASIVASEWSFFQPVQEADRGPAPAKAAEIKPPVRVAAIDVAAIESAPPQIAASHPAANAVTPQILARQTLARQVPTNIEAKTSLVDFETAPFPYHGNTPGSDRPFLNAGEEGHRGHVNFRGHVYWESETYSDDRVLLHIPPGFDPKRPAVMVVFFHGHGADLARDVRDRQLLPAQITAAGANAVLVAPQFAFDAADSSAGKFWEPDGFKRFLDEAAQKLAKMYGDPRSVPTFGNMPIVIVAYSGGFGPTLAVLDRGGVSSRVRGLVLLDALYAGIDTFADWIANNRSTFFVSSYTPYTEHHNADLEHLLNEHSVPYGSELGRNHLQGTVTFLPAGDVPHRDFVTHAWTDNPITDILARMDDVDPKIATADITASKRN
jgi:hypothetical protein